MQEANKLEDIENDFPYRDILFLEHFTPRKHSRQSSSARAGQFSPFAALSGYDGQIQEVSRTTVSKKILSEYEKEKLDEQLFLAQQNKDTLIQVTYFEKDGKKKGGKYVYKKGYLYRIDSVHHFLLFRDKTSINMQDIVKIDIIDSSY